MKKLQYSQDYSSIRLLTDDELSQVTGGAVPLAVAVYYTGGFVAGVVGGWTFGRAFFG